MQRDLATRIWMQHYGVGGIHNSSKQPCVYGQRRLRLLGVPASAQRKWWTGGTGLSAACRHACTAALHSCKGHHFPSHSLYDHHMYACTAACACATCIRAAHSHCCMQWQSTHMKWVTCAGGMQHWHPCMRGADDGLWCKRP